MAYPTWRVESWYNDCGKFVGFRVVKGSGTTWRVASNGAFCVETGEAYSKVTMREAAIVLRDRLTAEEADARILADECRSILRDMLKSSARPAHNPTELTVPAIPLSWLEERLGRLCRVLSLADV